MKKFVTTLIVVLALFSNYLSFQLGGDLKYPNLSGPYESTCYIQVETNEVNIETLQPITMIGTGVLIGETETNYLVVTAGHICEHSLDGQVYLNFTNHVKTSGRIIYCEEVRTEDQKRFGLPGEDIAIISFPKSVGRLLTQPLDLNHPKDVFTIGCSKGEYPSVVLAKAICLVPGGFFIDFHPAPGRSGSGVFSSKGVAGIVLTQGGCCLSAEKIKKVLDCVAPEVDKSGFWSIIGEDFHKWFNQGALPKLDESMKAPLPTEVGDAE